MSGGVQPFAASTAAVRLAFRAAPRLAVGAFGFSLGAAAVQGLGAWWMKQLLDNAARGDRSGAILAAVLFGITTGGQATANWYGLQLRLRLMEWAALELDEHLIDITTGIGAIEQLERRDYRDRLDLIRAERHRVAGAFALITGLAGLALEVTLTAVLLAMVDPRLLLLLLFAVLPVLVARHAEERTRHAAEASVQDRRLGDHFYSVAVSPAAAKEVRLYRMQGVVAERQRVLWNAHVRVATRAASLAAVERFAGWALFLGAFGGAMLLVARGAVRGESTIGDLVLVLALSSRLNQQVSSGARQLSDWFRVAQSLHRLRWLEQVAASESSQEGRAEAPTTIGSGITLERVRFRYPGASTDALADVDLWLPAGSIVAVVGENGAGKSTLVKLLCGFYRPKGGRVLVDGAPLDAIAPVAWRRRLTGSFQDAIRPEFLLREAVGMGDLDKMDDEIRVGVALASARSAKLGDDVGLGTQLGVSWPSGVDLSGGQWQRVALARSAMRTTPLLVLLDEPTESLDPATEDEILSAMVGGASTRAASGAVAVIVTHRLASVRNADVIVLLHEGRVVEVGGHAELVAAGGRYAALYQLQRRAYGHVSPNTEEAARQ